MQGQRNTLHAIVEAVELEIESSRSNMNIEPNIHPNNRTHVSATPNMQGYINSANATNFLLENSTRRGGSFYVHDRMMAGAGNEEPGSAQICITEDKMAGSRNLVSNMTSALRLNDGQLVDTNSLPSEAANANIISYGFASDVIPHNISQVPVGSFCSHAALHVGSEVERAPPLSGSGICSSTDYNYGRTNHFNDGGRLSCKRKNMEGIAGHPFHDGHSYPFHWDGSSSSRSTALRRHDIGSASFSGLGATPAAGRHWEGSVVPRAGLMGGASMASEYRGNALSVSGAMEGHQRSVRSRRNSAHHQELMLPDLRPSGNLGWRLQPRSLSSVEQSVNSDSAGVSASSVLHEASQFLVPSSIQRRNLVSGGWNEDVLRVGIQFNSNAIGVDNWTANNYLANWAPTNRNTNSIVYPARVCPNPIPNPRSTMPWHPFQNQHMQAGRGNPGAAQVPVSSSRPPQSYHFPQPLVSVPFAPSVDMALHPAAGLQGSHYSSSTFMGHRGDQNIRPFVRNNLDLSVERLQTLPNEGDGRNRIMAEIVSVLELVHRSDNLRFEDVLMLDRPAFYAAADLHDQHRDMRLDVDNMSYEELLALEERIGNVSTGLTEESISMCLKKNVYSSCTDSSSADETSQKCSICQEEYEQGDELGKLECGHYHHTECIKKWLSQKNECPICKAAALNT